MQNMKVESPSNNDTHPTSNLKIYSFVNASKMGNVGISILRTAPLFHSTMLISQRISQYYAFSTFLSPDLPTVHRPTFKPWFRIVCPRFLSIVTALSLIQYILLAVNTGPTPFHDPKLLRTKILFGIGLALSLVQYVLMPRMLKLYNGMMNEDTGDEEAWEMLVKWLRLNN
ncbi:hypothetical protein BKA61DRAFT_69275 [Leptodontidium sp. MPI-SDFR-AT-0119]|nr:hypothetical protein BKA61DRAFT_69275 [Leptodontidium sp. MPI-SDFR-AT-0119]